MNILFRLLDPVILDASTSLWYSGISEYHIWVIRCISMNPCPVSVIILARKVWRLFWNLLVWVKAVSCETKSWQVLVRGWTANEVRKLAHYRPLRVILSTLIFQISIFFTFYFKYGIKLLSKNNGVHSLVCISFFLDVNKVECVFRNRGNEGEQSCPQGTV